MVADPPSCLPTVPNTDTVIGLKIKSNWRQKVKSRFQVPSSSRPNGVTTSKQIFPPQGSRVAFLAVKIDMDDVTNDGLKVDNDVTHFDEKSFCDNYECDSVTPATFCLTNPEQDMKEQAVAFIEADPRCEMNNDVTHDNVLNLTVLGEVRFCNGTSVSTASATKGDSLGSENRTCFYPDSDAIDHVTTISVDVHNLDFIRGNFKASPVSSAGPECSCGESCPCSSYDSEEERPGS